MAAKPLTTQEAQAMVLKHGNLSRASRAEGIPASTLYDALHREKVLEARKCRRAKRERTVLRSLEEFRKAHDPLWQIRNGIKTLFDGTDRYLTEAEFRAAIGASPVRWRSAAGSKEFEANRYRVQGETLWASTETIRAMRRIRGEVI